MSDSRFNAVLEKVEEVCTVAGYRLSSLLKDETHYPPGMIFVNSLEIRGDLTVFTAAIVALSLTEGNDGVREKYLIAEFRRFSTTKDMEVVEDECVKAARMFMLAIIQHGILRPQPMEHKEP